MRHPRRRLLPLGALAAAGAIAGCGSSNSPDTAHIQPPPSQSQTLSFTATSTSTTPAAPVPPAIVTPHSGRLSVEPTIHVPHGSAPKTLHRKDLIVGGGAVARAGDTVTVNYVGALYSNGKIFDASWKSGRTYSTPLGIGQVIKGWDLGLVGMRVGGRRELIIPPSLAYGSTASRSIPANSTLIFVVDLLAVTPPTGATGVTGATVVSGALGSTGASGSTGATG